MRRTEAKLWDRMRPKLLQSGIFAERIENVAGEGTPDIHVVYRGFAAWVELKAVPNWPFRETTAVMGSRTEVRREQKVWHAKYADAGGTSYIALGVGSADIFLIDGIYASECGAWTANELKTRAAHGWARIIHILAGGS